MRIRASEAGTTAAPNPASTNVRIVGIMLSCTMCAGLPAASTICRSTWLK